MYTRILVVVENEPMANAAIAQGLSLAREHLAELVFLSVVPEVSMPLADFPVLSVDASDVMLRAADSKSQADLAAARQLAEEAQVTCRVVKVSARDAASCVVSTADQLGCDLVIVESLGRNSVMRLLVGSVIPGLITLSTTPVMVVRHGTVTPAHGSAMHHHRAADAAMHA